MTWLMMAVWAISLVYVMQTCQKQQQQPTGPVNTIQQNEAAIRAAAAPLNDSDASKLFSQTLIPQLNDARGAIDQKLKIHKISADEAVSEKHDLDAIEVQMSVVVSDARLRGGEFTNDYNRFQQAYDLAYQYQQKFGASNLWKEPVELKDRDGKTYDLSGEQLYAKTVEELSAKNKNTPVWLVVPGYQIVDFLVHLTVAVPSFSYWFAPFLLALLIRALIWPLTQRQLMWGRQMSQLQPMLKEIKKQYPDQQTQQKKFMELYAEYGIHPLAGCWPAFIQMPLFIVLYQCMLRYKFEFQKGTFLWIHPGSTGWLAPNLGQKDVVLIIIYGVTMVISTLLTPVTDPTQVKQQRLIGLSMAVLFPFMMLSGAYLVPSAFVLYWTFTNIMATMQSLRAYYLLPAPPLEKVSTAPGGVYPKKRRQSFLERLMEQAQTQYEDQQKNREEQAKNLAGGNGIAGKPKDKPPGETPKKKADANQTPRADNKQKPRRRQ